MYNDQTIIKKQLETNLSHQFGAKLKNDVLLLIDTISGIDTYIDENLLPKLQNLLALTPKQATDLTRITLELSSASAVAAILLLEKIPTLTFYNLSEEIGDFVLNIKDYGSRAVALYLGSEQTNTLRVEDLVDVLEQSTLPFYKALLNAVNSRHQEFGVCCAMIMRFAAKIEKVIQPTQINTYLDVCSAVIKLYGAKIAEQYIRHSHEFISFIALDSILRNLEAFSEKSLAYVEFAVTFPIIIFSTHAKSAANPINFNQCNSDDLKAIKIEILKNEDYLTFLESPQLFADKDYTSLMMNWPNLTSTVKSNMLFQLTQANYKNYILTHGEIEDKRNHVNQVTNANWLKPWLYCNEVVDLLFIRTRMKNLLQEQRHFSLAVKSIVKNHQDVFDRSNTDYTPDRVLGMLNILHSYCKDEMAKEELSAMVEFLSGDTNALKNILSKTSLVIKTWDRDPWTDYGRSDEFFSCTSLGDYNSGNAPAFLSDINLNNLDIWSNGARVGRIRLCLIKDEANHPLLLLDCVDGTERAIASQKKFELIMSAVIAYTRYLNINSIKVNYDVDFNTTPKKFISHVEEAYQEHNRVEFVSRFLTESTTRQLIPYPCQTFLESFVKNTGAFVRGTLITDLKRNHNESK